MPLPAVISPPPADPATGRPSVVLADPHGVYRTGIARALRRDGYDVTILDDGADAVVTARDLGPDLLLVADGLPTVGGVDVVRALASDPRTQGTRFLVLTADPGAALDRRALAAGADAVIDKACSRREICALVGEELARTRRPEERVPPATPPGRRFGRPRRLRWARQSG